MKNEELNIQSAIVHYFRWCGLLVFSVPNGTHVKSFGTRGLLKNSGLMSGVSDLILVASSAVYFIEIKTERGGQSDNQKAFQEAVEKLGFTYEILRSVDDAQDFYGKYLK